MFAPPNNTGRKESLLTSQSKYHEYINIALMNKHETEIQKQLEKIKSLASPLFRLFREGTSITWDDIWLAMNENKNNEYANVVEVLDKYLQEVISKVVVPKEHEYPANYTGGRRRLSYKARRTKRRRHRSAKHYRSARRA